MTIRFMELKERRARRVAGFTLIEILLVIVIILLLAGALVVFVLPQQEGAEKNTTRLKLSQIATALDTYRLNLGRYPSEQDGGLDALLKKPNFDNPKLAEKWQGPYLKPGISIDDAWGHPLKYELVDRTLETGTGASGPPYKLYSVGPDGQPETDDDIQLATENQDAGGSSASAD